MTGKFTASNTYLIYEKQQDLIEVLIFFSFSDKLYSYIHSSSDLTYAYILINSIPLEFNSLNIYMDLSACIQCMLKFYTLHRQAQDFIDISRRHFIFRLFNCGGADEN